jgi:hypothetical protein
VAVNVKVAVMAATDRAKRIFLEKVPGSGIKL